MVGRRPLESGTQGKLRRSQITNHACLSHISRPTGRHTARVTLTLPDRLGRVYVVLQILTGYRRTVDKGCSVSVVVGRRTRDREVVSSVPSQ